MTRVQKTKGNGGAGHTIPLTGGKDVHIADVALDDIILKMVTLRVPIIGTTPLIVNAWSAKAIKQIEDKQQGKAEKQREKRDPEAEYLASMYPYINAKGKQEGNAMKAAAAKAALVAACRQVPGLKMTQMKGAFHVMGQDGDLSPDSMMQILTPDFKGPAKSKMRRDMVRLESGVADVRYRAEFTEWAMIITLRFEENAISIKQMANLVQRAGISSGIGEWRPSAPKSPNGVCGMFEMATNIRV